MLTAVNYSESETIIGHVGRVKVVLPHEENEEVNHAIDDFVKKMRPSIEYRCRERGGDPEKAVRDTFLGSKGEYFLKKYATDTYSYPEIALDLEIREGAKKGWYPDLPYSNIDSQLRDIHCKTCNYDTFRFCGDYSWTFQFSNRSGGGGRDVLFDTNHPNYNIDLIALMYIADLRENEAYVCSVMPWHIAANFLRNPRKRDLIGIKKCLYHKYLCRQAVKVADLIEIEEEYF